MMRSRVDRLHVRYTMAHIEQSDGWKSRWRISSMVEKHDSSANTWVSLAVEVDEEAIPSETVPLNWIIGF